MGVEYRISDVKWSTFEDDVNAMLGCNFQSRGVKRKLEVEKLIEDEEKQKQLIFATSLEKLNKFRKIPDACLLQSVLVCNTIRHIKKQLDQEEINGIYNSTLMYTLNNSVLTSSDPPDCSSVTAAMLPSSVNTEVSKQNVPSPLGINDNNTNSEYDRYLHEFDNSGRMTPFLRTAQNKADQCALSYEESDRLQSLNWSSVLNFTNFENNGSNVNANASSTDHDSDYSSSNTIDHDYLFGEISPSLHTLMPPTTTSVTNSSPLPSIMLSFPSLSTVTNNTTASIPTSSVLSSDTSNDNDEIVFGDIDLTLYDYDLLSPLSPPMAAATDDDLMTSISDYEDEDEDEDEEEEESL